MSFLDDACRSTGSASVKVPGGEAGSLSCHTDHTHTICQPATNRSTRSLSIHHSLPKADCYVLMTDLSSCHRTEGSLIWSPLVRQNGELYITASFTVCKIFPQF